MQLKNNDVGIVLAGGMSSRYGSPKAFEQYGGKAYFTIVHDILSSVCSRVIIVTNEQLQHKFPKDYETIVDLPMVKGKGPLAGIYTVMSHVNAERYVVLPCDMPLITTDVICYLIQHYQPLITVATEHKTIHPLVSIWSKDVKEQLFHSLQTNQLMMKKVLETIKTHYLPVDHLSRNRPVLMNVNTRENVKELRKWTQSSMSSEGQ